MVVPFLKRLKGSRVRFLNPFLVPLVAAAILSGCTESGGSALPPGAGSLAQSATGSAVSASAFGLTQSVAASRNGLFLIGRTGAQPAASCPSEYTACFAVDSAHPVSEEFCISDSGDCSSGLDGTWDWTAVVTVVKTGKILKSGKGPVTAVWSRDPGNPSTITISTDIKKLHKHPAVKWAVTLSTCNSSMCFSDFVTYGIEN